ncbi:MAG TPA: response regulator transcription factor [Firmicutes bacterium]|nr:response regulator transcription factor [Bacillota bacterium]
MTEQILVVDDEPDTRETMALFLMHQGYGVQSAANAERAWEELCRKTFDLVVLDVMMPGMNGFDLLKKIRATAALKNLPVIMVTALDKTSDGVRAFELGADDYLTKPFVNAELIARTSTALRHRRLENEQSRGVQLEAFKEALGRIAHQMNQPLVQLTRCSRQLFKEVEELDPELNSIRRDLYDQCVRIQLILKQLEKIKTLNAQ